MAAADTIAVNSEGSPLVLDTVSLVAALARERGRGRSGAELAAIFHESLAQAIVAACARLGADLGVEPRGTERWRLSECTAPGRVETLLEARGLLVYANHEVPANDGGVSLGQALVAASHVLEAD